MELIAMKCTRAEYESIKDQVGPLSMENAQDFTFYDYLINIKSGYVQMDRYFNGPHRKEYKTFDKDIFLKACGIDPNKIIFDMVRKHFKHAGNCLSVAGHKFNAQEYDFDKMGIFYNGVFVLPFNAKDERDGKTLYNVETKEFATIVTPKRLKLSDSILLDFNPFPHEEGLKTWNARQIGINKLEHKPLAPKGPTQLTRVDIENILGYEIKIIKDV